VVNVILLAPIHEVIEHKDGLFHVKLSSTQETQQIVVVILRVIRNVIVLDVLPKDLELLLLLLAHISHETIQVVD
jgi:hypothetical protein